jgi:hypothetical protein
MRRSQASVPLRYSRSKPDHRVVVVIVFNQRPATYNRKLRVLSRALISRLENSDQVSPTHMHDVNCEMTTSSINNRFVAQ